MLISQEIPYISAAIIGLGHRGLATLSRMRHIPAVRIEACVDPDNDSLHAAAQTALKYGMHMPRMLNDWHELLPGAPVTLLIICSPRNTHTSISIAAMHRGFDVAVEVPAATRMDECRNLVETVRLTGRWFTMLENCCYDPFTLITGQMIKEGVFGQLTHCEGAYIHDLRERSDYLNEMLSDKLSNPYPTHGIGPMCRLLGIGTEDKLISLCSLSSTAISDSLINTTILRTRLGRTMLLQLDMTTPRPYSRLQTVCGTRGYICKYPIETLQADSIGPDPLSGETLREYLSHLSHPLLDRYEAEGTRLGVENMMNYIMDRRIADLYLNHDTPDITVNDAALWSSIAPLTAISASHGGRPVTISDDYMTTEIID